MQPYSIVIQARFFSSYQTRVKNPKVKSTGHVLAVTEHPIENPSFLKNHCFYFDYQIDAAVIKSLSAEISNAGGRVIPSYKRSAVTAVVLVHRSGAVYVDVWCSFMLGTNATG